jgi:acetamidase/formamidase
LVYLGQKLPTFKTRMKTIFDENLSFVITNPAKLLLYFTHSTLQSRGTPALLGVYKKYLFLQTWPTAPHVIEHPRHTLEVVDFICYRAENAYIMMSNKVDWRSSVLKERKNTDLNLTLVLNYFFKHPVRLHDVS